MIENPPLLTIRRRFARPNPHQVGAFMGVPTSFVVDALGGRGALDGRIKPITSAAGFHGVAITCEAGPADNLAVFGALAAAEPGDIIVCAADGFEKTSVTGDLLLGMMKNRGLAGFVTGYFCRPALTASWLKSCAATESASFASFCPVTAKLSSRPRLSTKSTV